MYDTCMSFYDLIPVQKKVFTNFWFLEWNVLWYDGWKAWNSGVRKDNRC
jgi:hypothetical protein